MHNDLHWWVNAIKATIWIALSALVARYGLKRWCSRGFDPSEPQEIHALLPGIGHFIGLVRHGLRYYTALNFRYRLPAYTLNMLGQKLYIVNSPDLVVAVQRNTKDLSSAPFVVAMAPRLFQVDQATIEILKRNLDGKDGPRGLIEDISHSTWPEMALGDNLDSMVSTLLNNVIPFLDDVALQQTSDCFDLYTPIRRALTLASTDLLYGPENPFRKDSHLEDAFWTFEKDATFLLLGVSPAIVARKANRARSRIFDAMRTYTAAGFETGASPMTQKRYEVFRRHGLNTEAISKFELSNIFAILINAIPSMFWLLFHIYSDPILLAEIRAELSSCFTTERTLDGTAKHTMNVALIRENTPLLTSCYREMLRLKTNSAWTRQVVRDTMLHGTNAKYLLKQGSIVQVPGASMHADSVLWGLDVGSFNPRRFLKSEKVHRPGSFRTFGGGSSICPGRHFAMMEILSSAAIWLMRFDAIPVERLRSGKVIESSWQMPRADGNDVINTISPPTSPCFVKVQVRKGNEGIWGFEMGQSNKGFEIS